MTTSDEAAISAASRAYSGDDEVPGLGWLFFAGTMLGLAGLMRIVDAIWAFTYDGPLPGVGSEEFHDGLLGDKLTTYGWVDPDTDTVHIPIDRAMELLAEQGLPVYEGETQGEQPGLDEAHQLESEGGQPAEATAEPAP